VGEATKSGSGHDLRLRSRHLAAADQARVLAGAGQDKLR